MQIFAQIFDFLLSFVIMPRGKKLTEYEKGQIDAFRAEGKGYKAIAKELGRSTSGIKHYVLKHNDYGTKKRSGRPKKLTRRDERAIGRAASNSTKSTAEIKSDLNLNVSKRTVL